MAGRIRATKVFSSEHEIVVGVDGSRYSNNALEWAVSEARLRDAVVRAICVAPVRSEDNLDWTVDDALEQSTNIIDDAVELAQSLDPTVVVRGEVFTGPVADLLIIASEVADLLVVGARGRGLLGELVLGSVSRSCMDEARCPVVVVQEMAPTAGRVPPTRIVVEVEEAVGTDALHWAVEEAKLRPSQIEAVFDCATAHDNEDAHPLQLCDDMADRITQFTTSYVECRGVGVFFKERARCISNVRALLAACEGADLLVLSEIGTECVHRRASIVRQCILLAPCPVVVVGRSAANPKETTARRIFSKT
jgi:nucleotide-binding universal stress UspA family protein